MSDATIFCARCGAAGQRVNAYCRSCGGWLPDPTPAGPLPVRLRGLSPELRRRRVHTLQLLSALAAAAAGLITLAVSFGLHRDTLVIAALLCFLVVAWQGVAFFIGRGAHDRRGQEPDGGAPSLPKAQGAERPALGEAETAGLVPPPSATEGTTALLDPVPAKRGGQAGERGG